MKTNLFVTMAAAALILAGCTNDENEMDNWNGEIRLSSGLVVQTRANNSSDVPDKQIAAGQQIGIYVEGVAGETAYTGYTNVSADADGSGNFSNYSPTMYYPQSGKDVQISAYHPYSQATADTYDFTVETAQATDANYFKSDLLYSEKKTYARSKTAHSLTFKHKLVKVVCRLTSGVGTPDIKGATVEIVTPERAVSFNRTTGVVANASTSAKGDNVRLGQYGAIIAPQTYAKGTKFLKVILTNGGELYYTIPDGAADTDLILASGSVYTFNITVDLTELKVSSSISDWTPVAAKTGNATMDD
uniref:fimbrillin family protein n=1 Tax=uncultured Bacteroides sp. TaxID=162156 RepID=UPI0025DE6535|nr:fimbrillin family protein [uncultured Bacteroides sp.]